MKSASQPCSRTRKVSSALNRCQRSRWTPVDDEILKSLMNDFKSSSDLKSPSFKWSDLASHFEGKTGTDVSHRWNNVLNPDLKKGSWTKEEDNTIRNWVKSRGEREWNNLSKTMNKTRSGKQLRERWINSLSIKNKKRNWTTDEDETIYRLYNDIGPKWKDIAVTLIGRTENDVKNRWHSLRRMEDRVCMGLEPCFKRGRKRKSECESQNIKNELFSFDISHFTCGTNRNKIKTENTNDNTNNENISIKSTNLNSSSFIDSNFDGLFERSSKECDNDSLLQSLEPMNLFVDDCPKSIGSPLFDTRTFSKGEWVFDARTEDGGTGLLFNDESNSQLRDTMSLFTEPIIDKKRLF